MWIEAFPTLDAIKLHRHDEDRVFRDPLMWRETVLREEQHVDSNEILTSRDLDF